MKNYQKFTQFFINVKEDYDKSSMSNIDVHYSFIDYYKKAGITDIEKIKQIELKKAKEASDRMTLGFSLVNEYGSVYELEDDVMRYITMNHAPPKDIVKKLKLPFKSIFIETEITRDDVDSLGVDKICGMLIVETSILSRVELENSSLDYKNHGRIFIIYYLCEDMHKYWIDEFKIVIDTIDDLHFHYGDKSTFNFLKRFLMNFILFLNDPEVEYVYHKRDEKNIERRIRQGKSVLPDSRKVRLIGKLKRYIDNVRGDLVKGKFNFRFWVRGFYRTLSSDKYTYMRGKIIRIEPFVKGQGMLLKRSYELSFEKNDERKSDELTMSDVK